MDFEKQAVKGSRFLNELAIALGDRSGTGRAGRLLQAVFRALRQRLTLDESFQMLSQLPMPLKAVYVDGWIPAKKSKEIARKTDFILEVMALEGNTSWKDFSNVEEGTNAVITVFRILRKHISDGEFEDMIHVLPSQLKKLMKRSMKEAETAN